MGAFSLRALSISAIEGASVSAAFSVACRYQLFDHYPFDIENVIIPLNK